jgi:hypothetical protein
MRQFLSATGFEIVHYERFVYSLNHLYVAVKTVSADRNVHTVT